MQCKRPRLDFWVGKIPWRRAWQLTPVFLPGESHGQRSRVGYSLQGHRVGHEWSGNTFTTHRDYTKDWKTIYFKGKRTHIYWLCTVRQGLGQTLYIMCLCTHIPTYADLCTTAVATHSILLPGKSHRRRILVGCSPWGRKKSDTTEWLTLSLSGRFCAWRIVKWEGRRCPK